MKSVKFIRGYFKTENLTQSLAIQDFLIDKLGYRWVGGI